MKIVRYLLYGLATLLVIFIGIVGYNYWQIKQAVYGKKGPDRESVLKYYAEPYSSDADIQFFTSFQFAADSFASPALKYGPYTRWWWPGNDVKKEELEREINLFASAGIAGVEIQPFTMGLNPKMSEERSKRVYSWDTPAFYENVGAAMEAARNAGITVDMNSNGGWPTGGEHIALEDNFKTLLFSEKSVSGGKPIEWKVSTPAAPLSSYLTASLNRIGVSFFQGSKLHADKAKLQCVVAAKVLQNNRSRWAIQVNDQIVLDSSSVVVLDKFVDKENTLKWDAPEGEWHIVAFWSLPADEPPVLIPSKNSPYVVDHFDSARVVVNYNYLFGKRTGLEKYYGHPFRSIFNDSYEFKADRHYFTGFFDYFRQKRGYDIRPYLPVNMVPGYNHMIGHFLFPNSTPEFAYGEPDERIRYDYDLTISEALFDNFFEGSRRWMNIRNLRHKTQAYGLPMDNIQAAKYADIPEAEQLYAEGAQAFLKLVSSGSHLYNRPLTTCETAVYINRAYMNTPLKLKISVDKAFTSGINQVVYHGTSYLYKNEDFGPEGWFPWCSPYATFNFSADIRETENFWEFIPKVNGYVKRVQYALQSGKPESDVLVYFPYLGVGYQTGVSTTTETLIKGRLKGVEPVIDNTIPLSFGNDTTHKGKNVKWLQKAYRTLTILDANGISWDWANNESILEAQVVNGNISIRGNTYQSIILPTIPHIPLEVAQKLQALAGQGAQVVLTESLPRQQPGFHQYKQNDAAIAHIFKTAVANKQLTFFASAKDLKKWMDENQWPVKYRQESPSVYHIRRVMTSGDQVVFFRNDAETWQNLELSPVQNFKNAYWLNPLNGERYQGTIAHPQFNLPPYGSILLYLTNTTLPDTKILPGTFDNQRTEVAQLSKWNVKVGNFTASDTALFSWLDNEQTRFSGERGEYRTTVDFSPAAGKTYILELGKVYHAAKVTINEKDAGELIFAPYDLDITPYLKAGQNTVAITVIPTQLNEMIGKANAGNKHYKHMKGKDDTLIPQGLVGPVKITQAANQLADKKLLLP